jgi:hypothetical protein
MANQEIVERFRNHGIDVQADMSLARVPAQLKEADPETLWLVLEDFTDNKPIGLNSPNENMHQLTLSYALVDAFENDRQVITQDDVDRAFERAAKFSESMVRGSSKKPDEPKDDETVSGSENVQKPAQKRKRSKTLMPNVKAVVSDNPKAETDELIELIQKREPNAKEGTIRAYISNARKELGLSTGKRGRKPSNLYPSIKTMVQDNPDATADEIVERAVNEIDCKPNTARAYYSKAKKELGL